MRRQFLAFLVAAWCAQPHSLLAATVFEDGFEAGILAAPWSTGATAAGRVSVETQYEPATGQRHLVLDDSVNDAVPSVAEAVLKVSLEQRRNAVLSFKAKSLGNEPHPPPTGPITTVREFDAVCLSFDGGSTWYAAQSLAGLGPSWESFAIGLDEVAAAAGAGFSSDVRVRFSAYDNSPAPLDGIAIDDVHLQADESLGAVLELPGTSFAEGSGPHHGFVLLSAAPAADLVLQVAAIPNDQIVAPATITVRAGETAAPFSFYGPLRVRILRPRTQRVDPGIPSPRVGGFHGDDWGSRIRNGGG